MTLYSDFMALMAKGGPIMWVIFIAACIAMIMLIWQSFRIFSLSNSARQDYANLQNSNDFIPSNSAYNSSPVAQLLTLINWGDVTNKEDLAKEMNIHLAEIMPKLEGTLPTVATLGSLLPMLGLLGTVIGMINVFEAIALHGTGDPGEMAVGISQALLTTASGLIIAIPVIFFHHLLARRVNALTAITGQAMQMILHRDIALYNTKIKS